MGSKSLLAYISILIISLLLSSCGSGTSVVPAPPLIEPKAGEIETVFVSRGIVEALSVLPGVTRAPTMPASLENRSGTLGTLYAFPGDTVSEGQVLARLDTPVLDEQIETLEKTIEQATAFHKLNLEEISIQIRQMESAGLSASQTRLIRLDRQYAIRRHELEMADLGEKLEDLYNERRQTEIVAPIDGEIVLSYIVGANVFAKQAVMHIAGSGNVYVEFIGEPINVSWDGRKVQGEINGKIYDLRQFTYTLAERAAYNSAGIAPPARFDIITASPEASTTNFAGKNSRPSVLSVIIPLQSLPSITGKEQSKSYRSVIPSLIISSFSDRANTEGLNMAAYLS